VPVTRAAVLVNLVASFKLSVWTVNVEPVGAMYNLPELVLSTNLNTSVTGYDPSVKPNQPDS
jgi:hypothetical protein